MNHRITVLLLTLVSLGGCATSGIEAVGRPSDPQAEKRLIIHNESLAKVITVSKMRTRTSGDLLAVEATLTNLSNRDIQVQYRFSWYDAGDFEVEPGKQGWTPVTLHGRASASIQGIAPNPSVTSYRIHIREAR